MVKLLIPNCIHWENQDIIGLALIQTVLSMVLSPCKHSKITSISRNNFKILNTIFKHLSQSHCSKFGLRAYNQCSLWHLSLLRGQGASSFTWPPPPWNKKCYINIPKLPALFEYNSALMVIQSFIYLLNYCKYYSRYSMQ